MAMARESERGSAGSSPSVTRSGMQWAQVPRVVHAPPLILRRFPWRYADAWGGDGNSILGHLASRRARPETTTTGWAPVHSSPLRLHSLCPILYLCWWHAHRTLVCSHVLQDPRPLPRSSSALDLLASPLPTEGQERGRTDTCSRHIEHLPPFLPLPPLPRCGAFRKSRRSCSPTRRRTACLPVTETSVDPADRLGRRFSSSPACSPTTGESWPTRVRWWLRLQRPPMSSSLRSRATARMQRCAMGKRERGPYQ